MKHKNSQESVHQSQELLRVAAWAGKMYAYEWDLATGIVVRSPECKNILGLQEPMRVRRDELLTRVHPDDREKFVASAAQLSPEKPISQITYRMTLPDGGMVWLEKSGRAFFDRHGTMLRMIGMVADVTERKLAEEALSGVSRRLIEAQEQERTRIARDLHDDVAQRLAMVAIELEQLRRAVPDSPADIRARLGELHRDMANISRDVQEMSHELHSSKLAYLGTEAAIESFCYELSERHGVKIDFESRDFPKDLPSEISLCLFRVVQEALHNAVKHSGTRDFNVQLWARNHTLHLLVRDSGIGFDVNGARQCPGLGLTSMQERLRLVQGALSVESRPNRGTTIHARVPFRPDLEPASERVNGNRRGASASGARREAGDLQRSTELSKLTAPQQSGR